MSDFTLRCIKEPCRKCL